MGVKRWRWGWEELGEGVWENTFCEILKELIKMYLKRDEMRKMMILLQELGRKETTSILG